MCSHHLKISALLRCPLENLAHMDCCWVCGSPIGSGPPKHGSIHFKLPSGSFSISWYLIEQSWNFGFLAYQGSEKNANFCRRATRTIPVTAPPRWLAECYRVSFQLCPSAWSEPWGLSVHTLAAQHPSALEQVNGVWIPVSYKPPSLFPILPVNEWVWPFAAWTASLLPPSLLTSTQSWAHFPLPRSLFFRLLWSSSELDQQLVAGWCQLTLVPDVMENGTQVQWASFKQVPRCEKNHGSQARHFRTWISVSLFKTTRLWEFLRINGLAECKGLPSLVGWARSKGQTSDFSWWKAGNSELLLDTFCFSLGFFFIVAMGWASYRGLCLAKKQMRFLSWGHGAQGGGSRGKPEDEASFPTKVARRGCSEVL